MSTPDDILTVLRGCRGWEATLNTSATIHTGIVDGVELATQHLLLRNATAKPRGGRPTALPGRQVWSLPTKGATLSQTEGRVVIRWQEVPSQGGQPQNYQLLLTKPR